MSAKVMSDQDIIDALRVGRTFSRAAKLLDVTNEAIRYRVNRDPELQRIYDDVTDALYAQIRHLMSSYGETEAVALILDMTPHELRSILSTMTRRQSADSSRSPSSPSMDEPTGTPDTMTTPSHPHNGNGNGHQQEVIASKVTEGGSLPLWLKRRIGRALHIYRTPVEISDVWGLRVKIHGTWFPIPLANDGARICTGPNRPMWSVDQETYTGVDAYEIRFKNGACETFNHDPSEPFTVAPLYESVGIDAESED